MSSMREDPRSDGDDAAVVHPTACVEDGAVLGPGVVIGAFAFVGREVELGPRVEVAQHATLIGCTSVGSDSRIFPHAVLGGEPQDTGFAGESTRLEIGARTVLREHVTVNIGTARGGGCTRLGEDNYLMNGAHVGHDCQIGDHTIIIALPSCTFG